MLLEEGDFFQTRVGCWIQRLVKSFLFISPRGGEDLRQCFVAILLYRATGDGVTGF